jgi:hypothetical protein
MTIVSYSFKNPDDSDFNGYLAVVLPRRVVTLTLWYPPQVVVQKPVSLPGTINLAPSDALGVPYQFSLYRGTSPDGTLVDQWEALVPDTAVTVPMSSLAPSSVAITDIEAGQAAIIRRMYADSLFWAGFQTNVFVPRGAYNASTLYRRGDMVYHASKTWLYKNAQSTIGTTPVDGAFWQTLLG